MATLVWSSTGAVVRYYEDAVQLYTKSGMTSQNFPNTEQRIGTERANGSGIAWNGKLDEWGVWRRVLTGAEITSLYASGS